MSMMPASRPATPDGTNLADILERVLDRGVVIAGDIKISLLDIELLTIKLRLVVASVDTAREMGIDWWERDPFLSSRPRAVTADDGGPAEDGSRPALPAARRRDHDADVRSDATGRRADTNDLRSGGDGRRGGGDERAAVRRRRQDDRDRIEARRGPQ